MSVELSYETIEPVLPYVATQLVAEAAALAREYDWWCEPLKIAANASGRLGGTTRMFLGRYLPKSGAEVIEVVDDEEWLMIWSDVTFVIARLSLWSLKYQLNWKLSSEGDPVGKILNGTQDERISTFVQGLRSVSSLADDQVAVISHKYASRKTPFLPRLIPSNISVPQRNLDMLFPDKPWWKIW
jgi:hypothetical protein